MEKKGIYGALLSIIKGYIYFSTATGMYCGAGYYVLQTRPARPVFLVHFFGLFTIPLLTFLMGIEWCCYLFARFLP